MLDGPWVVCGCSGTLWEGFGSSRGLEESLGGFKSLVLGGKYVIKMLRKLEEQYDERKGFRR